MTNDKIQMTKMTEQELISLLTQGLPRHVDGLKVGIGDDCAVIEGEGCDWLVTTDALFEGIHFNFDYTTDLLLGRKSLSVNLSDIAAMGGLPLFYFVSLGVPSGFSADRLASLYKGMREIADQAKAVLAGGDTCASKSGLVLSITVIGRAEKGGALLRSGAKPGDAIYATGTFGDGALGLACFKKELRGERIAPFVKRYNDPAARIAAGQWLAGTGVVTSMIDVSDGLLADLGHICEMSKAGFEIALTGGEDYELIFTVDGGRVTEFEKQKTVHKVTRIGTIQKNPEDRIVLGTDGRRLEFSRKGYDHFSV
jgi:thiamine-monophosphate kinase